MVTSASLKASTKGESTEECAWHPPRPRKFAPVAGNGTATSEVDHSDPEKLESSKLKGIIFDVDGTLCLPQNYMFREMRSALNIEKSVDILDHIRSLSFTPDNSTSEPESSPQSRARDAIRAIETNAMSSQQPQPGLVELMNYLEDRSIPKALCTRNFPTPVQHLIVTFLSDLKMGFDMIVTRETKGLAPKPSPEGLWAISKLWQSKEDGTKSTDSSKRMLIDENMDPLEVAKRSLGGGIIMVGDSIDDMAAGYRAGAATVLLLNEDNESLAEHKYVDLTIGRLDELIQILDNGFTGKVSTNT